MPRSGTTWISQIFASSPDVRLKFCPLFSYEFKNALNESSSTEEWRELFEKVYHTQSEYLDQEHLRKRGLIPEFKKKAQPSNLVIKSNRFHHLMPTLLDKHDSIRIIHIVRHPCATLYSWLNNPNEFPDSASPEEEWRQGLCRKNAIGEFWGFDDWKKVTLSALRLSKKYPARHRIIRYEDLVAQPNRKSEALFTFLNIGFPQVTKKFIVDSQSKHDTHKHSIYKKDVLIDLWKQQLSPSIIETCIEETKGTELEQFTKPSTL